ncbi:MAG: iron ABC transporter permease [Lachnospiraceae bacterium]|jgi:iron complex transport system permease protein|nr:iron ABC transporter permease [Lachnospiraceae bacterium]MCI1329330.1 iron ABC transporter permease [Lachnospiraceae bacterium]
MNRSSYNETARSFHDERVRRRVRCLSVFIILAVALILILILNISLGNVRIPAGKIAEILFAGGGDINERNIIWKIRLPRALMGLILGGALSVSGFLLQTFFQNPIAGPYVLGISSGAKMTVAIVMIYFLNRAASVSSIALILAAFVGSMISTAFILLIAKKIQNMAALLVAGIMIGYICSAVTDFVITFADDSDIANLHSWSQGSFSGMNWDGVAISAVVVGVSFVLTFLMAKPIGAWQLGETYAQTMGINTRRFRIILILLSSVLTACVTAYAGPISFIGIAVPYLIRHALGTSNPIAVIPACFLGGSVFCTACDLIARMAFAPTELRISTVSSVFGAPVVIFMMIKGRMGKGSGS